MQNSVEDNCQMQQQIPSSDLLLIRLLFYHFYHISDMFIFINPY